MVGAQVALTLLMLTAASAAGKGFLHLVKADLGYDPHNTMSVPIPGPRKHARLLEGPLRIFRTASCPHRCHAGSRHRRGISTNATPPSNGNDNRFEIMGRNDGEKPEARLNFVSPEYFPLLHIPLSQGRIWDHAETMRGATVAVINQTMARQYWPNGNAIGQQFRTSRPERRAALLRPLRRAATVGCKSSASSRTCATTVCATRSSPPSTFLTRSKCGCSRRSSCARTSHLSRSFATSAPRSFRSIPNSRSCDVRDLEAWITNLPEYGQQRLVATLFGIFSVLALVLAAVGLYSVVSYGVATRTNEFGIRMALGAKAADVFRIVLSSTALNVGAGLAAGIFLSFAFNKFATKWVNESSRDPLILGRRHPYPDRRRSPGLLRPARRAAAVDPMVALRYE